MDAVGMSLVRSTKVEIYRFIETPRASFRATPLALKFLRYFNRPRGAWSRFCVWSARAIYFANRASSVDTLLSRQNARREGALAPSVSSFCHCSYSVMLVLPQIYGVRQIFNLVHKWKWTLKLTSATNLPIHIPMPIGFAKYIFCGC